MTLDPNIVIRAWREPSYRASLADEVARAVPPHPAGTRSFEPRIALAPEVRGSDGWTRAAWLDELRPGGITDRAEGAARVDAWRRCTRQDATAFAARLARSGLDEAGFAALLGGERIPRQGGSFADAIAAIDEALDPADAAGSPADRRVLFAGFVLPFAHAAERRVRPALARAAAILSAEARAGLATDIQVQLAGRAARTLLLHLGIERVRGALDGDETTNRFGAFADACAAPARRRAILAEHPLLARTLAVAARAWADAVGELLDRLVEDLPVAERVAGGSLRPVAAIRTHLSDPHRGGRTVAFVVGAGGRGVVYKPRSLALDERFQDLLAGLHEAGVAHGHRRLRVADRGSHGWVELVARAPCADRAAAGRFYHRQGSLLAILYLLRGVDFHHENVVASGEHPVLVDLEALFQHRLIGRPRPLPGDPAALIETGFLPHARETPGRDLPDHSGLVGPDGETFTQSGLVDVARDTMRIAPALTTVRPGANRPVLDGRACHAAEFVDAVTDGFRDTWEVCARARAWLAGWMAGCADVEVRFFARPTHRYTLVLRDALHPDLQRDALEVELLLDGLHLEAEALPALAALIPSEQRDLRRLDVPCFHARPGGVTLFDAGGATIAGILAGDSLGEALGRLDDLDAAGRERSTAVIHAALLGHARAVTR